MTGELTASPVCLSRRWALREVSRWDGGRPGSAPPLRHCSPSVLRVSVGANWVASLPRWSADRGVLTSSSGRRTPDPPRVSFSLLRRTVTTGAADGDVRHVSGAT